jgi:hypothetical protein
MLFLNILVVILPFLLKQLASVYQLLLDKYSNSGTGKKSLQFIWRDYHDFNKSLVNPIRILLCPVLLPVKFINSLFASQKAFTYESVKIFFTNAFTMDKIRGIK